MASSSAAINTATAESVEDVRVADPKCSRGFTYVMYEANAWQLKFAKSGQTPTLFPDDRLSAEKAKLAQQSCRTCKAYSSCLEDGGPEVRLHA